LRKQLRVLATALTSVVAAAPVLLLLGVDAFAQNSPVTVYVFATPASNTNPGGFVDRNTEQADREFDQREDSVRNIRKSLEGKKGVKVVDSSKEAQVILEVTWRSASSMKFNPLRPTPDPPLEVQARLSIPTSDYSLKIIGRPRIHVGWRGAAESITHQIEEWVKMNRERLSIISLADRN
jgi:hypothetical protein